MLDVPGMHSELGWQQEGRQHRINNRPAKSSPALKTNCPTWRGLEILLSFSSAISFHCDTHPTVRATANSTVYLYKHSRLMCFATVEIWLPDTAEIT